MISLTSTNRQVVIKACLFADKRKIEQIIFFRDNILKIILNYEKYHKLTIYNKINNNSLFCQHERLMVIKNQLNKINYTKINRKIK